MYLYVNDWDGRGVTNTPMHSFLSIPWRIVLLTLSGEIIDQLIHLRVKAYQSTYEL